MWILIAESKKHCWRLWTIFTLLLLGLTLIQSISGKLIEIMGFSWLWLMLNLIPGLLMILIAHLKDQQSAKVLPAKAHWAIWGSTVLYLLVLLFTLLAEQLATSSVVSMKVYRLNALYWLLPFQGVLLIAYYFMYYRKKMLFRINKRAVAQAAGIQAKKWSEKENALRESCFQMIADGKVDEALAKFKQNVETTGIGDINQIIALESQLVQNQKNLRNNLISFDEGDRIRNRIIMSLMDLINQV